MFIELWSDGERVLVNTDHIARVSTAKGGSVEIEFTHVPWDLPDGYRQGDPLEQGINTLYFDVSYDDFVRAVQSGRHFVSLCDEPQP